MQDSISHSHIFTNKNGNTLMREFEGVLSNNPTIKNLDAVVGFLRASGYFTLRPFLDNINKARVLFGINVDKYIVEAARQGKIFFGAEDEVKEDCLRQVRYDIEHAGYTRLFHLGNQKGHRPLTRPSVVPGCLYMLCISSLSFCQNLIFFHFWHKKRMSFVKLAETCLIISATHFSLSALFFRSLFQIENTE